MLFYNDIVVHPIRSYKQMSMGDGDCGLLASTEQKYSFLYYNHTLMFICTIIMLIFTTHLPRCQSLAEDGRPSLLSFHLMEIMSSIKLIGQDSLLHNPVVLQTTRRKNTNSCFPFIQLELSPAQEPHSVNFISMSNSLKQVRNQALTSAQNSLIAILHIV